jgi:hypothetical protein
MHFRFRYYESYSGEMTAPPPKMMRTDGSTTLSSWTSPEATPQFHQEQDSTYLSVEGAFSMSPPSGSFKLTSSADSSTIKPWITTSPNPMQTVDPNYYGVQAVQYAASAVALGVGAYGLYQMCKRSRQLKAALW